MKDNVTPLHRLCADESVGDDDTLVGGPVNPMVVTKIRDLLRAAEQGKVRAFAAAVVLEGTAGETVFASTSQSTNADHNHALYVAAHRMMRALDEWML
jgi:hypothetical protein